MGDSVQYRDGVFVATGPQGTAADGSTAPSTGTGTALMVRPDGHLAAVDAAGPMAAAGLPPTVSPGPRATAGAGGARRVAVATVAASLVAAVAFGAAAFAGAFGPGPSGPGSARGALGAAAADSAAAMSVAFTLSATRSTPSSVTTLVSGSGAVDLTSGTGRLTAAVPSLSTYVGSGNDTVDLVTDAGSVYVGSPALSSITGGTWLRADLPTGSGPGDADSSTLAVLGDPSQLLGLLSSIGGQVATVGHVDLGGVPTTEYRTTVTLSELASRAGLTSGTTLGARVARVLGQLGSSSVPVTAWVGSDGYVRQLSASLDLSRLTLGGLAADLVHGTLGGSVSGQATTATTVTVGFSHYGQPVAVSVPPATQVTDLNGLVSSIRGVVSDVTRAVSGVASGL